MQLAFYAPMKPPDHTVPSGDRAIARGLIAALKHGGAHVDVASKVQTRDGKGDATVQRALMAAAKAETLRCIADGQTAGWHAWITYHNYYKAPDLIGPCVAQALGIPYIQIESTRARKRLNGDWAAFARAAEAATDAAALVFYFSTRDAEALTRDAPSTQQLVQLNPFLDRHDLPSASTPGGPMLSVGMMREGDKLASYRIIAETLALLDVCEWQLQIAGDGPARPQVEAMMAPFGARISFLGQLSKDQLAQAYQNAGLFFWPGVNEALGMVYLEAQAAGLPVIAQDRPGMRDVLAPGQYPDVTAGAPPLAARIKQMLKNTGEQRAFGTDARTYVAQHHLLPQAATTLKTALVRIGVAQ